MITDGNQLSARHRDAAAADADEGVLAVCRDDDDDDADEGVLAEAARESYSERV